MRGTTMIKLRMATGLGLLLLTATMAGKFETRGSGVYTLCYRENFTEEVDCASAPHEEVPYKLTAVAHNIRDAAGNSCAFTTMTGAPTDGSGTESLDRYAGGRCNGAVFDSTGAILEGTGTQSFMVSDSGNRIETIITSFSVVASPFGEAGSMKETMPVNNATSIRQSD